MPESLEMAVIPAHAHVDCRSESSGTSRQSAASLRRRNTDGRSSHGTPRDDLSSHDEATSSAMPNILITAARCLRSNVTTTIIALIGVPFLCYQVWSNNAMKRVAQWSAHDDALANCLNMQVRRTVLAIHRGQKVHD